MKKKSTAKTRARRRNVTGSTPESAKMRLALKHQLLVSGSPRASHIQIANSSGRTALKIVIDASGIALELGALAINVEADGGLTVEAERLTLVGRRSVSLVTRGDLEVRADGALTMEAREQKLVAALGNVDVRANDDVTLNGERVLLNS
jgi:hypothetical protein